MKPNKYVHTPDDGRARGRLVTVNGNRVERVVYADTKRGIVRMARDPLRLDRWGKRVLLKTVRGEVSVIEPTA